ncbi:MAG: AAA family ATPase, partial [Dehalococcoidia bacterium]
MLTFIQMHGEPGSGKSTLARALGARLPAVVVDKDLIASGAIRAGIPLANAGPVAYEALWLLLPSLLEQGHSVIHDSPCYWPNIEEQGRAIAASFNARYEMIEVTCDVGAIETRLATREALESNPRKRLTTVRPGMYRPSCPRLVIDGQLPVDALVDRVVEYLQAPLKESRLADPGALAVRGPEAVHDARENLRPARPRNGPRSRESRRRL